MQLGGLLHQTGRDVDAPCHTEVPGQRAGEAVGAAAEVEGGFACEGEAPLLRGRHQALDLDAARAEELVTIPATEALARLGES
jgi:hypothetical protein